MPAAPDAGGVEHASASRLWDGGVRVKVREGFGVWIATHMFSFTAGLVLPVRNSSHKCELLKGSALRRS